MMNSRPAQPSGYQQIYEGLKPRLAQLNFTEAAARLGLGQVSGEGRVVIPFLGRLFSAGPSGVEVLDGRPVEVNFLSVLSYYLLSEGRGEPEFDFWPLSRMTGLVESRQGWQGRTGMLAKPLLQEFAHDYERFRKAALVVGGLETQSQGLDHFWLFFLLPKIPVRLIFREADEEFGAEVEVFFDRCAPEFLEFEILAFLSGCFTKALLQAGRNLTEGLESAEQLFVR